MTADGRGSGPWRAAARDHRGRPAGRRRRVRAGLGYTPIEARQGVAQKIFYLHVPSAWSALLAFSLVGIASALYLWLHDPRLDRFAAASAEVGLAFSAVMLTTGPIWAKPIWGTWWTWDARLTLTLFLFFLFIGYLALRAALQDPGERARFSAVVGILGLLLVPFIHLSVYLFRTLHPAAGGAQAEPALAAARDAADAAHLGRGVPGALRRAGDDPLRAGAGRGSRGARRCRLTTRATRWRRTSWPR